MVDGETISVETPAYSKNLSFEQSGDTLFIDGFEFRQVNE